jgi:hypothetical protein
MVKRFLGNAFVRLGVKCLQTIDACNNGALEISHCSLLPIKAALRRRAFPSPCAGSGYRAVIALGNGKNTP